MCACTYTLKISPCSVEWQSWEVGSVFSPRLGSPSAQAAATGCHHRPADAGAGSALAGSRSPHRSQRRAPHPGPPQLLEHHPARLHRLGLCSQLPLDRENAVCCVPPLASRDCIWRRAGIWAEKARWALSGLVLDV